MLEQEPGTEWVSKPEKCGFCGKKDICGYAKKDGQVWKPCCGICIIPPVEAEVQVAKRKDDDISDSTIHDGGTKLAPMDAPTIERREVGEHGRQQPPSGRAAGARVVPRLPKQGKSVHREPKRKRDIHGRRPVKLHKEAAG